MGQSSREVRIIGPLRDAGCLNKEKQLFFSNFVVMSGNTLYLFYFVCVFSVVVVN